MRVVVLLLVFFISIELYSDATYPLSVSNVYFYQDGNLLFETTASTISQNSFFLINTDWTSNTETLYYWKGIHQNITKGKGSTYIRTLDAIVFRDELRLIIKENDNIFLTTFDTTDNENKIWIAQKPLNTNVNWIQTDSNNLFLMLDRCLYKIDFINNNTTIQLIEENVISAVSLSGRDDYKLAYLVDRNDFGFVYLFDNSGNRVYSGRVKIATNNKLLKLRNQLLIISAFGENTGAYLHWFDIFNNKLISTNWTNDNLNLSCASRSENAYFYLTSDKNQFQIIRKDNDDSIQVSMPDNLHTPLYLNNSDDHIIVVFSNAILMYDNNLTCILFDYVDMSSFSKPQALVSVNYFPKEEVLFLKSKSHSVRIDIKQNDIWYINRQIMLTYRYAITILLVLSFFILYRKYRNQKRLLSSVLDLPSSGFIFFIDKMGRLIRVNDIGKKILNISDNDQKYKLFETYCQTDETKELSDIVNTGLVNRIPIEQKISVQDSNKLKEWLCWIAPMFNITGRFSGLVLNGIDISDTMEKQLLTNWSQLAHDMQTNLSTIRLNTESISVNNESDIEKKQKILHQISILVHRIKDIVIVGGSDKLELSTINSIVFCEELVDEFDKNIFSNILFSIDVKEFSFQGDKKKLQRAMRNAIENSIKNMKKSGGKIVIGAETDIHNITLFVKDTGTGMDEKVLNKFFTPYFSTARKEGGSGIGTIIIKRVIELHGGKVKINSKKGTGTELYFILPNLQRNQIKKI